METVLTAVIGVPVAVLVGLAMLLFFLLRTERQLVDKNGNVVPGPPTAVVAGNIGYFSTYHKELRLSEGIVELQKKFHAHPYMSIIFPGARMIVCGCPEAAKVVLTGSHTNFPKSPKYEAMECVLGQGLVTSNGDLWKQHRSLMSPAFHADNLKPMVDSFSRHAEEMASIWVEKLQKQQSGAKAEPGRFAIDFHHAMTALTGDIICDVGFGYQLDAKRDLNYELFQALEIALKEMVLRFQEPFKFTRYLPTARNRRFAWGMKALSKVIDSILHQRMAEAEQVRIGAMQPPQRRTDLLDLMLQAKDSETGAKFTDAGIRDEVFTFLGAGHETTANMLSWTMYELGHHPQVKVRIQEELDRVLQGRAPTYSDINSLDYLNMVIKESLRLHPPVSAIARDAPKGLDLPTSKCFDSNIGLAKNSSRASGSEDEEESKDQSIAYSFTGEQDVRLMVPIYVLHRDPHSWEQPEEFVPERWSPELTPFKDSEKEKHRHPFAYVPFSAGPRSCIGQRFALLEGAAILAVLLQRFDISLQNKDRIAPEETITVRPRGGVHAFVSLRQK